MPFLSNEFTDSQDDNKVRPYTSGLKRHEETLATIVVFKEDDVTLEDNDEKDFLDPLQFFSQIKSVSADILEGPLRATHGQVITSGTPRTPSGSVTTLELDGTNPFYGIFNNFSLLSVQEANEQIVKLHVNFGSDWNAFFFGEKPRVYQFGGFFLDSPEYPYYQEFMVAYDKYLSGRKAIENKVQTTFIYDGRIVDGYMLDISTQHSAADQQIKNFTFTVLVRGSFWIRNNLISTKNESGKKARLGEQSFNGLTNLYRLDRYSSSGEVQKTKGAELNEQGSDNDNRRRQ